MKLIRVLLAGLTVCLLCTVALAGGVASRDTTFLLGGPDRWDGRFETPAGEADWHGWFHYGPVDDYTLLNRDLPDDDPDQDNFSWQVNWRNFDPNEAPPGFRLDNLVVSPPVSLPEDLQQLVYAFDVGVNADAMGQQMTYEWHVRSTADSEPAGLDLAPWMDRGFVYSGTPGYHRREEAVGDLLVSGARWVQVAFQVVDVANFFPTTGEGAPYLDNVAIKAVTSGLTSTLPDGALSVAIYPNPFNPRTTIALELPRSSPVSVRLFDGAGRLVGTLNDGEMPAGRSELVWDGVDRFGRAVPSGSYLCVLAVDGRQQVRRLTLVR
jgi:hypothetical protein